MELLDGCDPVEELVCREEVGFLEVAADFRNVLRISHMCFETCKQVDNRRKRKRNAALLKFANDRFL